MAKTSSVEKNKRRRKLTAQYAPKRAKLKAIAADLKKPAEERFAARIADGSISPCDPKMTAFALAGAMNWIAHWHRADAELTPDQIADRFLSTFVSGLKPR